MYNSFIGRNGIDDYLKRGKSMSSIYSLFTRKEKVKKAKNKYLGYDVLLDVQKEIN